MKKVIVIFLNLLIIYSLFPLQIFAATTCTGETTGTSGTCTLLQRDCSGWFDGQGGCTELFDGNCCVNTPNPPNPNCTGESTNNPGVCVFPSSNCANPKVTDGAGGCFNFLGVAGASCCVQPADKVKPPASETPPEKGPAAPATGTTNANLPAFISGEGKCADDEVYSALGCLPTDGQTFANEFFKWSLPIAGLIAFLLIIYGSFLRIVSAGNPENMQKARDIIVAALTGLLIVIFAVVILQIITRNILGLPGFSGTITTIGPPGIF